MTKLELLNVFLNDRMTAAAEEIFRAVKDTFVEYQSEIHRSKEENERLKRLLNVAVQRLLLQPGPGKDERCPLFLTYHVTSHVDVLFDLISFLAKVFEIQPLLKGFSHYTETGTSIKNKQIHYYKLNSGFISPQGFS